MSREIDRVLAEQRLYYRERAAEYEDWWFRRGRYDHGDEANKRWFAEAARVQADLGLFDPAGRVIELACGTGLWTERLAAVAEHVTALDSAPEAMEIARATVDATNVDFIEADLFQWEPEQAYDVCFFAFWLSHVPQERVREFWEKVRRGLAPGGRVYLVDSARSERASARDHTLQDPDQQLMLRRLSDGREYRIVKHWFDAPALQRQLTRLGWDAGIEATAEFFIHGQAKPRV